MAGLLSPNGDAQDSIRRIGARRPGPVAPKGQVPGDIWYDTANLTLNVWTGTYWQIVSGAGISPGTSAFYNGLELYQPASTPYIDFHRAANSAGDGGADYDVRLILDANDRLSLIGGGLRMSAGNFWMESGQLYITNGWLRTQTTGQGWYHEVHGGGIFMRNNTSVEVYGGREFYAENWIGALEARMGRWGGSAGHAVFTHSGSGSLGYMVRNDYRLWAMCNGTFHVRADGNDVIAFQNDYLHHYRPINMARNQIRLYEWNDGNHVVVYLAGSDTEGPNVHGWGGGQIRSAANDATARLQWGDGNFVLFDNGGAWGMKSIPSGLKLKQEVKTLDKKSALDKVRKLRPVEFKRKYYDARPERRKKLEEAKAKPRPKSLPDPGPHPGDDADEETINDWLKALQKKEERDRAIVEYEWEIENAEALLEHMEWRWKTQFDTDVQRPELGFIAEEMNEIEPAAVLPPPPICPVRPPGQRKEGMRTAMELPPEHERITTHSIMYGQLTALLAAALQEEDEVVKSTVEKAIKMEAKLVAQEKKLVAQEEKMEKRIAAQEAKIAAQEEKLVAQEQKLAQSEARLKGVEKKVTGTNSPE